VVSDADATPGTDDFAGELRQEVRHVVLRALDLAAHEAPEDLNVGTCPRWDSLGQLAVAAALFDRYGIKVEGRQVFQLTSVQAIVDLIAHEPAGRNAQPIVGDAVPVSVEPVAPEPREAAQRLPDDLEMLPLLPTQLATQLLAASLNGQPKHGHPLRVTILASFTAHSIEPALELWGRAFGFDVDCRFAPYNQIVQALLDTTGASVPGTDCVSVVLVRPEDLASSSLDAADALIDEMLTAVAQAAARRAGNERLFVGTLPPTVSSFAVFDRAQTEDLRYRWRSRAGTIPGVELFDFAHVVERAGIESARSTDSEVLARAPYSPELHQELAVALVRQIRAARGTRAKVIALDCDNTLWGGVIGEVGPEGIQLGADGPGRSFQLFQQRLKQLKERGFLLAVVSKNEAQDVRDVFERHPGMILRHDDIAAWRVNWMHKSDNLRELAEELNLGLDAFVLLDDDPAVRLEVKTRVPAVHVVPLPDEPTRFCETLERLWLFDGGLGTAVDAARTRMTHEERRRSEARQDALSLEDFLARLELHVDVSRATERDWPRVAQLTQRTNQFNLSLKRRTIDDLRLLAGEAVILVVSALDRFGDVWAGRRLRGAAVRDDGTWEIDTLLMSCRALGRGVEDAFLHGIASVAAQGSARRLTAPYVEGPRNQQVRAFLVRSGFTEAPANIWHRSLGELPPLPPHVHFRGPDVEDLSMARSAVSVSAAGDAGAAS
jgi:FkbH-like protein